jgi:hypothetical protein
VADVFDESARAEQLAWFPVIPLEKPGQQDGFLGIGLKSQ